MDTKTEFKLFRDKYDPWGSAMDVFFPIASELYMRGVDIPSQWGYAPGLTDDPRDPENYYTDLIINESDNDLLEFGNLLHRYTNYLDRAGCSY